MDDRAPNVATTTAILRRLAMPVYVPVVAGNLGLTMLVPVLPLYLTDSGLSLRLASIVLATLGLGASFGGLPTGALMGRFGERKVLIGAIAIFASATATLGTTTVALVLAALRLTSGAANGAIRLSRQTYITRRIDVGVRGRAMAMIGGSMRISLFIGPLIGGILVDLVGYTATFAIAGVLTATGMLPPLLVPDHIPLLAGREPKRRIGILRAISTHRRLLAKVGIIPMLVMTVREGRLVVIPLIGDDLGLSSSAVGAVVTVGTAADLMLFPVAGWVMDRFGRLAAMIPAFGLIACGLVALGMANGTPLVVAAGAIIGIGNGLCSGTMLTLGSDVAPPEAPGQFLAGLATMQEGGRVAGPLLVGAMGAAYGLGAAAYALALVLVVAIVWLVLIVGETGRQRVDIVG
ncbi:MFS transporter [uncultured Ilumatobacter sp.]|jgi:MFS family permease|uniref:MFS transporter n=1 Tax=uncultured Ilumatobacter sp. TaxID=879968 RepID=UPI00374F7E68|tara:strand:+ start:723 stop:1940 length:1218 start_codon:yes stop_codon:yes gene_type:complete